MTGDLFKIEDPAPTMKGFSLWQPWASLWLTESKPTETRHWKTGYRGWLAVHAAKRFERDFPVGHPLREILENEFGGHWAMDLPTGAILGAVELVSCDRMDRTSPAHDEDRVCGNWSDERFAWRRRRVIKLDRPIPFKGAQGFFSIPIDVAGEMMQRVPA
jgi:hypothetical protein